MTNDSKDEPWSETNARMPPPLAGNTGNAEGVEPDVVLACAGDVPTLETLAAADWLREHVPELRLRVVNVVDLMALFPREEWTLLSHLLIFHGRQICIARRPKCGECVLAELCPSARV